MITKRLSGGSLKFLPENGDILKYAPDAINATVQAQKIEELSHLIEAVEAAAKDDRKRLG